MAVGARILSNNLSGQTVEVLFYPTSGGTIDLGTQTIPFNNITTDPYGVYEIYVPYYDYTYELVINQSILSGESFTWVSKLISNNNNGAAILNFNDFTAQVIDLDVDYTGWYIDNIYPLTNSGYAYYFQNDSTCDLQWVIFTDAFGNVLESFETNCNCNFDYDVLGGKWVTFNDYYNGILKYSNGANVYTQTYDPSYQELFYYNDWDGVTSNDTFVIGIVDYNINTLTNYIVDGDNLTQFGAVLNTTTNGIQTMSTYFSGDFISQLTDNNSGFYTSFDIFNSNNGLLLESIDLTTGDTYDNYYLQYYGDNKMLVAFYTGGNTSVDYFIIHYDGNTNVLNTTTNPRVNVPYVTIDSNTNLFPNNGGSESFVITLYDISSYTNYGTVVTYCNLIYMLSGDTDFNTYTFQNSGIGDKVIDVNFVTSNSLTTICDNGDGFISTLTLVPSGATYHTTNVLSNSGGGINNYEVGNNFVGVIYTDINYTGCTLINTLQDGTLGDIVTGITLGSSYSQSTSSISNLFQFTNYNETYHIDGTSNLFQSGNTLNITGNTISTRTPEGQFKYDFLTTGPILTFDYNTMDVNILTSTGYTSTFTMPQNTAFGITVGSDKFMFTYMDLSGNTNIHLYDFNFNLLNSLVTPYNGVGWDTIDACGDRFTTTINDNNQYIVYLVSESTITSTTLTDNNDYNTMNDYVWWD